MPVVSGTGSDLGNRAAAPRAAPPGQGADGQPDRRGRGFDPYDGGNALYRFTAYGIRNPWVLWEMRQAGGFTELWERPVCLQDFGDGDSLDVARRIFSDLEIEVTEQLR